MPRKIICLFFFALMFGCSRSEFSQSQPLETFTNSVGMVMIKLPHGYYVSIYETRQSEFEAIMDYNPSRRYIAPDYPVHSLTGAEAIRFTKELTAHDLVKPKGYIYLLPTFKQWRQYVADAPIENSITPRGQGDTLLTCLPVGHGESNKYGLFDLRGNVAEYSIDKSYRGSQIILGASWNTHSSDKYPVSNKSYFMSSEDSSSNVGFRCVLVPRRTSSQKVPLGPTLDRASEK